MRLTIRRGLAKPPESTRTQFALDQNEIRKAERVPLLQFYDGSMTGAELHPVCVSKDGVVKRQLREHPDATMSPTRLPKLRMGDTDDALIAPQGHQLVLSGSSGMGRSALLVHFAQSGGSSSDRDRHC
jgi:hypothetical protein